MHSACVNLKGLISVVQHFAKVAQWFSRTAGKAVKFKKLLVILETNASRNRLGTYTENLHPRAGVPNLERVRHKWHGQDPCVAISRPGMGQMG